jgi:serine protease
MRNVLFLILGSLALWHPASARATAGTTGAPAQLAAPGPVMSADRARGFAAAAAGRLRYLPDEVVVKYRNRGVTVLDAADPARARAMALELSGRTDVEFAEPNYLYNVTPRADRRMAGLSERDVLLQPRATVPNDPGFAARQWNFSQLDMTRAWDIEPGGKASIIVAVIDTGITTVTQNLQFANWNGSAIVQQNFAFAVNADLAASRLVAPFDFLSNTTQVVDMDGHGTHVSSTIGEDTNNALGDSGMAYNVKIMPVKVCASFWDVQFAYSAAGIPGQAPFDAGGCPNSAIAQGIRYAADNGARVINISLGGDEASAAIKSAIQYAVSKGAFVAAAGGNEYEQGNLADYPAAEAASIDGFMAVAATNRSLNRAFYSNTGSYIEIAAPGGDSRDQSSGTGYVWQSTLIFTDQDPGPGFYTPRFDRYAEIGYQGTSMATPHVSGLAALMMSRGITLPAAIEAVIKKTAKDIGASGKDTSFGYGLIQPRTALFGVGILR